MAKKKAAFNLLNIVDESQLNANLEMLQNSKSSVAPTKKEVEIITTESGEIAMLPLSELKPYHNHTYKVLDNADMEILVDSIRDYGILLPLIVRELNGGGYEIISGHRRHFAATKLGLKEVPCKIMDLDDDMADIVMADTNIARETILPSEKARTYKVRLDAAVRQGKKIQSEIDVMTEESSDSARNIRRFIKLNSLLPALLDKVDEGLIPVNAGVILSDLSETHQRAISAAVSEPEAAISLKDAEKLKTASSRGLTEETVNEILSGKRKPRNAKKKTQKNPALTEEMLLDVVPDDIKELPLDERVDFYKEAIRAFASRR